MKKFYFTLIITFAVLCSAFAQKDYSSIYFYVPKRISVLPATMHVSINGTPIGELKKGELLEYRITSPQNMLIEVQGRGNEVMSKPAVIELEVLDVEEYYYEVKWTLSGIKFEKVQSVPRRLKDKNTNVITT